jgi:hypothetical protein
MVEFIACVVVKGTAPEFFAAAACDTAVDRLSAYVKELCFNTVFLQSASDFSQRGKGAALFIRASIH